MSEQKVVKPSPKTHVNQMIENRNASIFSGLRINHSLAAGCLSVFSSMAFPASCIGQVAYTPTDGPKAIIPNFGNAIPQYSIETGVNCPGMTLNVLGFGGNVNAWGDRHYPPFESNSAGLGNYGVAAGVSIPLNRALMDYCKKYAKETLEQQRILGTNRAINSQFAMFRHCEYFSNRGFSFNEDEFNQTDGPLSIFKSCKSLKNLLSAQKRLDRTPRSPIPRSPIGPRVPDAPSSLQPEPAPSAPLNPPAVPVFITR